MDKNSERKSTIKPFLDKYNWKDIFNQGKMTGKNSTKNNPVIALNVLYIDCILIMEIFILIMKKYILPMFQTRIH